MADDLHRAEAHRRANQTRHAKAEQARRHAFGHSLVNAVKWPLRRRAPQPQGLVPVAHA
jgi:hypothetical protein